MKLNAFLSATALVGSLAAFPASASAAAAQPQDAQVDCSVQPTPAGCPAPADGAPTTSVAAGAAGTPEADAN